MLSAYGLALADVVEEVQEPCSLQYEQNSFKELNRRVEQLSKRCHDTLCARGFTRSAPTNITCFGVNLMTPHQGFVYHGIYREKKYHVNFPIEIQ